MNEIEPADDGAETYVAADEARANRLRLAYTYAVRRYRYLRTGVEIQYRTGPAFDGGYESRTKRTYPPLWPRLVDEADAAGMDPVYLLDVLFSSWTGDASPLPQLITSDENIARARNRARLEEADIATAVKTEAEVFRSALWAASRTVADPDPVAAVRYVINGLGYAISPLFRYAMAVATGDGELSARWRPRAELQYRRNPAAYRTHWAHLLPADLTQQEVVREER